MNTRPIDRLRHLIETRFDGNQADLARAIGRQPAQIYQWLNGLRGFGGASQRHIEMTLSLPTGWFLNGSISSDEADSSVLIAQNSRATDAGKGYAIRQLDTGGRMGTSGLVLRDQPGVIKAWHVSHEWMRQNVHRITSPANLAIVTGFGDSMRPLYNPGDPLLVDTGRKRVDVDGIYFFRVGEEGFIKRLQRIPTAQGTVIRAKSENPAYDPFEITSGMDFEVFGWVVKAWRGEDF